jgi:AmmeMemoRadiSam system protein A
VYSAKSPYVKLAIETIVAVALKMDTTTIKSRKIPDELKQQMACFVSIHLLDGSLRGCIGTIEPREKNLYFEIISNATAAATRDTRFSPISVDELENLEVSVDLLSKPYLIDNINNLNPKKLGIIVSDGGYSRGVLLPDIEEIDTVEKQLNIAKRKAGLSNYQIDELKIFAFTSTRYH